MSSRKIEIHKKEKRDHDMFKYESLFKLCMINRISRFKIADHSTRDVESRFGLLTHDVIHANLVLSTKQQRHYRQQDYIKVSSSSLKISFIALLAISSPKD